MWLFTNKSSVWPILANSLLFIKPEQLAIVVREEYNTKKMRAEFTFNRNAYRFTVTDPAVERKYLSRKAGLYRVDKETG